MAGPEEFRSGFVAVVGRPNTGKSTLVNALVGSKVAITSDRPQTTRGAIRGVVNTPEAQVVLIDTPGYHKPRTMLGRHLNQVVRSAWNEVDLTFFVVDGHSGIGRGDQKVASDLMASTAPVICVVNKIDAMRSGAIAEQLLAAATLGEYEEYVPVSAATGEGVKLLFDLALARLDPGPPYYPPGAATDQPPTRFVAELVREKLLHRMHDELPHSIAVVTEEYEERPNGLLSISAIVYVERDSQKGMVVGKGGSTIKSVGIEAREEIEVLFGRPVYLDLRVKVEKDWQRHGHALERLGFIE